jgi:undecaprenyl-diphosphatase
VSSLAALDGWLFEQINGFVGTWRIFDRLMATVVNEYFITVTLSLILLVLWFVGRSPEARRWNQQAVVCAVLAQGLANAIVKLNNLVYFRPRPFDNPALQVNLLFYRPTDSSMPSNPAAVGFAFATAIWLVNRRAGVVLYALATLFAFSRVYSGVHYPFDVVAGAGIGILAALIVHALVRGRLQPLVRGVVEVGRRLYLA